MAIPQEMELPFNEAVGSSLTVSADSNIGMLTGGSNQITNFLLVVCVHPVCVAYMCNPHAYVVYLPSHECLCMHMPHVCLASL